MAVLGSWLVQFLHPGRSGPGGGYWFWSGIGSDLGELTLVSLAAVWWRQHNCHVRRCWRLQWRTHPDHGHPVCGTHHPEHPSHCLRRERHFLDVREHRYPKVEAAPGRARKPSRPPDDPSNR